MWKQLTDGCCSVCVFMFQDEVKSSQDSEVGSQSVNETSPKVTPVKSPFPCRKTGKLSDYVGQVNSLGL